MREIKFRAWDKSSNKMLGVFAVGEYPQAFNEMQGEWYHPGMDNLEIMQFTGLHDKNGKEIWEGDVVIHDHCSRVLNCKVEFHNGAFVAVAIEKGKEYEHYDLSNGPSRGYEVLGNIYENPELLKP